MCPSEFFLELISFVPLFSRFGCFLEPGHCLLESRLEVRQSLLLLMKNLFSLVDVCQTRVVFLAELAKLRATEKELEKIEYQWRDFCTSEHTLYLSEG